MDRASALRLIQRMHETRTVTNEAIIAWYNFYAHQLPRMSPERSDLDLIRTVALWMELTDQGGSPGFPYEYNSELMFPSVNPSDYTTSFWSNVTFLPGVLSLVSGIFLLYFNWGLGLALIVAGAIILYVGYRLEGGPTNPRLMLEGTTLYEREGRRVIEWATKQAKTTLEI